MLEQKKRISIRISSVLSKVEPEPGADQKVPAPQHCPWQRGEIDLLESVQRKMEKEVSDLKGGSYKAASRSWGWTHWRRGGKTRTWCKLSRS